MNKAVILARVSTIRQEEEGHSLPAQIRRLQEYAKRKDFEIAETFSFSESAGDKIRKKFKEFPFPKFVDRWVVRWELRAREPIIIKNAIK